jgi:hypothetical protein
MPADDSFERPASQRLQSGFPISALGLLVTVFACLLVCADFPRWHEQYRALTANGSWWLVALVAVAGVVGAVIGLVRAIVSRSGWRMRLLAPVGGMLAGEAALFILIAPGPVWRTIFAITVLLGAAVLFRIDAD